MGWNQRSGRAPWILCQWMKCLRYLVCHSEFSLSSNTWRKRMGGKGAGKWLTEAHSNQRFRKPEPSQSRWLKRGNFNIDLGERMENGVEYHYPSCLSCEWIVSDHLALEYTLRLQNPRNKSHTTKTLSLRINYPSLLKFQQVLGRPHPSQYAREWQKATFSSNKTLPLGKVS